MQKTMAKPMNNHVYIYIYIHTHTHIIVLLSININLSSSYNQSILGYNKIEISHIINMSNAKLSRY